MLGDDLKDSPALRNVKATLAIENMHLSDEFLAELIKVEKGEKTSEKLREEVIQKYTIREREIMKK